MPKISDEVEYTRAMKDALKALHRKTGWGGPAMANRIQEEHGVSLSSGKINDLVGGHQLKVSQSDYDLVLSAYRDLPEDLWQQSRIAGRKKKRMPILDELRIDLRDALEALKMPHSSVLAVFSAPASINSQKLTNIASGRLKSVTEDEHAWLSNVIAKSIERR